MFPGQFPQCTSLEEKEKERGEEEDLPCPLMFAQIMEYFGSMDKSMLTLLIMGTILDDVTQCSETCMRLQSFERNSALTLELRLFF